MPFTRFRVLHIGPGSPAQARALVGDKSTPVQAPPAQAGRGTNAPASIPDAQSTAIQVEVTCPHEGSARTFWVPADRPYSTGGAPISEALMVVGPSRADSTLHEASLWILVGPQWSLAASEIEP